MKNKGKIMKTRSTKKNASRIESARMKVLNIFRELGGTVKNETALPISKKELEDLFDHLFLKNRPACDHSLKETTKYLSSRKLDVEKTVAWLNNNGGYCDCEVLLNVARRWGYFEKRA